MVKYLQSRLLKEDVIALVLIHLIEHQAVRGIITGSWLLLKPQILINSNWKFFRFGEILLNYAEAAAESGHLAEAKAAVDEVRARVKMPALPIGLSKEEMILRVHNERRVELAWEEVRYFDLRRWQKPDGNLNETCQWFTGMRITKLNDGSFNYQRYNISSNPRGGYQNRDLLLPLPLDEVSRLESTTGETWQNPGW